MHARSVLLSAYVLAMRCLVLTNRMLLSPYALAMLRPVVESRVLLAICLHYCYAMSGTDIPYDATSNPRFRCATFSVPPILYRSSFRELRVSFFVPEQT
eukprot:1295510-Rhodomonas_salina.2